MNPNFATAMGRALEQTRAGNGAEATRIIQAALAGDPGPETAAPSRAKPMDGIEDAEVLGISPPRNAAGAAAQPAEDAAPAASFRPGDLQQMLSRMGCMAPQGSAPFAGLGQSPLAGLGQSPVSGLSGLSGLSQSPLSGLAQGLPGMTRAGAPPPVPQGARYETRSFTSALGAREYRLFLPSTIGEGAKGLILMLHGCTQSPDDFASGTDMNTHAEREGLIVVYPHQTRAQNAQGCWNWFRPEDQRPDTGEAALLAALTREVMRDHGVPEGRVFAAGLSAGGAMAATLAATQPDLFQAVGIHSGLPHGIAHDIPSAFGAMRGQGGRAVPGGQGAVRMIILHGTADATVHPSNADKLVLAAGPALEGASRRETGRSPGGRSYSREIVEARDGAPLIETWRIEAAGHAWAGGRPEGSYTDPAGPDASAEMVRFFLQR